MQTLPKALAVAGTTVFGALAIGAVALAGPDFGQAIENQGKAHSMQNFGVVQPRRFLVSAVHQRGNGGR